MNDFESWLSTYHCSRKAQAKANTRNKERLFDALQAAGIGRVSVTFDGMGDSGQIEAVTAYAGREGTALPNATVAIETVQYSTAEIMANDLPLAQAIEELCYAYLAQEYDGWEDNDGASGVFGFDVGLRTVTLEFEQRYTDSTTYTHEF